jgi:antirestriction protein ArdC
MQATSSISHQSVYQIITEQIIKQLESGVAPWHRPWRTEPPCNLVTGQQYRGINVFSVGDSRLRLAVLVDVQSSE